MAPEDQDPDSVLEQTWAQNAGTAGWPQPDSLHQPLHVFQTWLRQLLWELTSLLAKVVHLILLHFTVLYLLLTSACPHALVLMLLLVFILRLLLSSRVVQAQRIKFGLFKSALVRHADCKVLLSEATEKVNNKQVSATPS